RTVAILSRGYKSKKLPFIRRLRRRWFGKFKPRVVHDGRRLLLDSAWAGDEPFMLARSLGNVLVLVDRDRARTGRHAIREFNADEELWDFVARAVRRDLDAIVTTEKDAVRIPARIGGVERLEVPIYFLRIEIEILSGQEAWDGLIHRLTERKEVRAPERVLA